MDMEDVIKGRESWDKVMIAIDESDCSHEALKWALDNLREKMKSSGLIIFHVRPVNYSGVYAGSYGASSSAVFGAKFAVPDLIVSIQENQKRLSAALLDKAKDICAKQGVEAETISVIGNPKDAIVDATEKLHTQLLVIGSHGKSVIKRAFLGSVSSYCVQNAKCPILVIRKATA